MFGSSEEYFLGAIRYGLPHILSLLRQSEFGLVLDRSYPSEWVYSRAFNRPTDEDAIRLCDAQFAELGGHVVITRRKSYDGIVDDTHPHLVNTEMLKKLDGLYEEFAAQCIAPCHTIFVDDENLNREVKEILSKIEGWTDD